MALTYNKDIRDLSIKGTITTNTGVQIHLTPDEIINYSFDSQIGSEGLPLGSAESSSFSLEFSNSEHAYTPSMFDNAEVHMFVGIHDGSDYVYSDFGVWYVDTSTAPEQSVSISLSGYDALATRFEDYFVDSKGAYPTTIGRIATDVCLASGIRLKTADFPNAGVTISKMPTWDEEVTLRDVLSYCAICAGGYVRIARNGQVEIVGFMDGQTYELDPDSYQTFTLTGGTAFKFNAIEAMLSEDAEEYTRYAVNSNIASDATNTIQIEYNPLLTDAILQSITTELSGIEIEAGTITWGGDPSVECTDYYNVTMLDGTVHKIMVTSQNFSFDGGLSVTESCDLPAKNAVGSPTYSTSTNMYDAKGRIKASRIPGLDKQVISATVGHFDQLTADTAEFDELLAAYINAINLLVDKIDANAIKAGTITADKISSDTLNTVSLEAITAKIESLTASDIETDRLAAALAAFTVVTAGTADFDRATVQHLVAKALNLEFGTAEQVFIKNLAVEFAQMVSASVGELCIKASDGNYYLLDVGANGSVTATKTTVSNSEINAGETSSGKVILETNITAANLNTGNLLATYALINRIDAARIDVDEFFAREAVIDLLRTTKIVGDRSITMIAGEVDNLDRLSNIEVIEGTFAQTERREGEGIRIYSEIGPKQDLKWGAPWPGGAGKNLLPNKATSQTVNGVTFTVNSDGSVTANGTATAEARLVLAQTGAAVYPAGSYIVTGCPIGGASGTYMLGAYFDVDGVTMWEGEFGYGRTYTATSSIQTHNTCIIIQKGYAASNLVFKPMLRLTSVTDATYEPYANTPPIEGWTGLEAGHRGKNLCGSAEDIVVQNGPSKATMTQNGNVFTLSTTSEYGGDGFFFGYGVFKKGKKYTVSGTVAGYVNVRIYDKTNMNAWLHLITPDTNGNFAYTFEATSDDVVFRVWVSVSAACTLSNFQIEEGDLTPYAPYQGNTYALDFGEKVYGGTVDWHAGEMTVDGGFEEYDGTEDWKADGNLFYLPLNSMVKTSDYTNVITCSHFIAASNNVFIDPLVGGISGYHDYNNSYYPGKNWVYARFSGADTVEKHKAYLAAQKAAGTPIQISYKLAEPYTIQLTPVQIETLQGINTVYTDADGGRVEFGYNLLENTVDALEDTVKGVQAIANDALPKVDFQRVVRIDEKGLHVGDNQSGGEVLVDSKSVNVVLSGRTFSSFAANYVEFGNYQLRRTADGGLAFKMR